MDLQFSINSIKTDLAAVLIFGGDGSFCEITPAVPQGDWLEFRAALERYGCRLDDTKRVHEYVSGPANSEVTLSFSGFFCLDDRQADPTGSPWCTFKGLQRWNDRCMNLVVELCRVASVTFTPSDDYIHPIWFGSPAEPPLHHQVRVLQSLGDVKAWLLERTSKT